MAQLQAAKAEATDPGFQYRSAKAREFVCACQGCGSIPSVMTLTAAITASIMPRVFCSRDVGLVNSSL